MHNFFVKTLYQKRFLALWWFVGITAMSLLTVSFYDSFKSTEFEEAFKSLPPALRNIAGDLAISKTVDGYLAQQLFSLRLPLLAIILSISLLIGLLAGDEQRGLLETQLSLPVSRTRLLLQKLAAALVILTLATSGAILGIVIGLTILQESFSFAHIAQYTLNCIAIATVYGLIGYAIAAVTGRRGLALGVASGFAFASYLIHTMAPSVSALAAVDKLTFFHYYQNTPFGWNNFFVLLAATAALIAISVIGFNKRDISAN